MTGSDWIQLVAITASIFLAVGGSAFALAKFFVKIASSHAVDADRVSSSLDRLNLTAEEMIEAIKDMKGRLNGHDIDIALLKQAQLREGL